MEEPVKSPIGLSVEEPIREIVESPVELAEEPVAAGVLAAVTTPLGSPIEVLVERPAETGKTELAPFAAADDTSWDHGDLQSAPQWQTEGSPLFLAENDDSLRSLGETVKTSEDLLALRERDRPDMVAFLEPAELSKAFMAATDPELKKAIIDTLEHVSNPASLDVLRRCLDDPDPRIQLYALNAADRLLGVD
jgi:hypothetical protein